MSLEQLLREEKEALESEHRDLKEQITAAEGRIRVIEERIALVDGLMAHPVSSAVHKTTTGIQTPKPAADIAFQILGERDGATMHYKELANEVISRGGDIPSENSAQILVARLVKDDRFVRPAKRGFYGLRKDYPTAKNVGARKARRLGRTRSNQ